jgi:malonate transporter and related proteins
MFATLGIVLPIFALILAGYICRKSGALGGQASSELNRFVVYLALPALLFDVMSKIQFSVLYQPGFVGAMSVGTGGLFVFTLLLRKRKHHVAEASLDALNASYANVGFIGLPLCAVALGSESLAPATLATMFTVCVLFAAAIILIELGIQTERSVSHALRKVASQLVRNPLLVAPILGVLVAATGRQLPASVESFVKLLGAASSPCALVALGLFLAERRTDFDKAGAVQLVLLKLVVHPAITWVLAYHVFSMPPVWAQSAVLLTALPTGTGPFMLAEFYDREATTTSATILFSTIGSLITVTLYLYILGRP